MNATWEDAIVIVNGLDELLDVQAGTVDVHRFREFQSVIQIHGDGDGTPVKLLQQNSTCQVIVSAVSRT